MAKAAPVDFELNGHPISLERLDAIYGSTLRVTLTDAAMRKVRGARERVERLLTGGEAIYGVNTGVGKLCNKRISGDQLAQLQHNLIVSHAVGVGPPIPPQLVRWMMLFKIHSFLAGASGVQPACAECLAAMLSADVLPVIPSRGSLGASGDLAPLAHMVLPMIGLGETWNGDEVEPAAAALARARIEPVKLGAKDGLALINGTQMMLSYAMGIIVRARRLAKLADITATLTLESIRGSLRPFGKGLVGLRPHPGAVEVGENVSRMMAGSEILVSHAGCDKVQDPYSIRCVPQVHGACRDALRHAAEVAERELASVTDNPVLVDGDVVSGGNFHGEPLALTLDYLSMALCEWAGISERRTFLLLSGPDGLPPLLMKDTGLNSGFMIPQYTAAALLNECKVLAAPACTDSVPTSLGQEDHVSMGAQSALKCWQIVENVESVLAIELLCAAQALDYRLPTRPGTGAKAALDAVRGHIPHSESDHLLGDDIRKAIDLVTRQEITRAVEAAIGVLK